MKRKRKCTARILLAALLPFTLGAGACSQASSQAAAALRQEEMIRTYVYSLCDAHQTEKAVEYLLNLQGTENEAIKTALLTEILGLEDAGEEDWIIGAPLPVSSTDSLIGLQENTIYLLSASGIFQGRDLDTGQITMETSYIDPDAPSFDWRAAEGMWNDGWIVSDGSTLYTLDLKTGKREALLDFYTMDAWVWADQLILCGLDGLYTVDLGQPKKKAELLYEETWPEVLDVEEADDSFLIASTSASGTLDPDSMNRENSTQTGKLLCLQPDGKVDSLSDEKAVDLLALDENRFAALVELSSSISSMFQENLNPVQVVLFENGKETARSDIFSLSASQAREGMISAEWNGQEVLVMPGQNDLTILDEKTLRPVVHDAFLDGIQHVAATSDPGMFLALNDEDAPGFVDGNSALAFLTSLPLSERGSFEKIERLDADHYALRGYQGAQECLWILTRHTDGDAADRYESSPAASQYLFLQKQDLSYVIQITALMQETYGSLPEQARITVYTNEQDIPVYEKTLDLQSALREMDDYFDTAASEWSAGIPAHAALVDQVPLLFVLDGKNVVSIRLDTGEQSSSSIDDLPGGLHSAQFSPDGRKLITTSQAGIILYAREEGRDSWQRRQSWPREPYGQSLPCFSGDGRYLLIPAAHSQGQLTLVNMDTLEETPVPSIDGQSNPEVPVPAEEAPDAPAIIRATNESALFLLSWTDEEMSCILDASSGIPQITCTIDQKTNESEAAFLDHDSRLILIRRLGSDCLQSVELYDVRSGKLLDQIGINSIETSGYKTIYASPQGQTFFLAPQGLYQSQYGGSTRYLSFGLGGKICGDRLCLNRTTGSAIQAMSLDGSFYAGIQNGQPFRQKVLSDEEILQKAQDWLDTRRQSR